jgi:Flp pilus assembly CpaE family ATPase
MPSALAIQLAESGADPERLDELTLMLRDELLNLDVDNVEQVRDGEAPSGTRGLELAALGALLVTLNQSTDVVAHVVNTIREWLKRDPEPTRTVRVTLGDRTIELSAASNEQQDRLVAEFVRASGGGKDGR